MLELSANASKVLFNRLDADYWAELDIHGKLAKLSDTAWLKHHSFYRFASNVTLTHKRLHSAKQLETFWPNCDANMALFRRPVAPIVDYDVLTLSAPPQDDAHAAQPRVPQAHQLRAHPRRRASYTSS